MATVSCSSKCTNIYSALGSYINFYAEKFPNYVINMLDPENQFRENVTLFELNEIGNGLIPYIGGKLLQTTSIPDTSDEDDESDILESSIIKAVSGYFEIIFTDFTHKNSNLTASEAWIEREGEYGTEEASKQKIRAMGILDQCPFLDKCLNRLNSGISSNFSTLGEAKSYLSSIISYVQNAVSYLERLGQLILDLDSFYIDTVSDYSGLALYATSGDYISHQYYTDEYGWTVLNNWDSTVGNMVQKIEDSVPVVRDNQVNEILTIISDIEAISEELNDNDSIELLEALKEEVKNQYLSSYIEEYGYRLAAIIRAMMSGVDRSTYDYNLIDKLTLIEQKLQQGILSATNRMTVHNYVSGIWSPYGEYKERNKELIINLKEAISAIENY